MSDSRLAYVEEGGYSGFALVLRGHNIDPKIIAQEAEIEGIEHPVVKEVFWIEQRRVMWCGNYGWACESEGEWHTHWHPAKPSANVNTHFTLLWEATDER